MSDKKLTNGIRLYYGLGAAPYGIKENGFSYFLLIFYSQVLGLSPVLTSAALSIAILFDAVSDPIVGYFRIIGVHAGAGGIRSCMSLLCRYHRLWVFMEPPGDILDNQTALFFYLVGMTIAVRLMFTFFEVPNTALISELTDDYESAQILWVCALCLVWSALALRF